MHIRWTECKFYLPDRKQGMQGLCRPANQVADCDVVIWFEDQTLTTMQRHKYEEAVRAKRIRVGTTVTLKKHLALEDEFKTLGFAAELKCLESSTLAPLQEKFAVPASQARQQSRQPALQTKS